MAFKDALIAASPALLGMGQQLSGRNPSGISSGLAMMNAEQEKAKRKAAIEGLIGSMGLSQQKADFLSMLPFEQASPIIWDLMNPRPVGGGRGPTQADIANTYAASLGGGMPAQSAPQQGGGFSMGVPDDLGSPVAAAGGLSLGRPAVESPAPATTPGLTFGNVAARNTPVGPQAAVNPYGQLRARIMSDLPRIQNDALNGVPGAQDVLQSRLSQLKALEALAPAEPEMTEADREISRLTSIGMSREEAIKLKEGVLQVIRDPVTGEAILYDVQERRAIRPMDEPTPQSPSQPAPSPLSFGTPYSAASDSFGAEGFLKGAANTVADVVGAPVPFSGVQATQADFKVLRENLTNKISAGYNGRVPAFLLQNIQNLTPKAGSITEGPEAAQSKLQALARSLVTERDSVIRQLSSRALSPTDRGNLETQLSALESSLADIGGTLAGFRSGTDQGITSSGIKYRIVE